MTNEQAIEFLKDAQSWLTIELDWGEPAVCIDGLLQDAIDLAIQALTQPTSAEVKRAIDWMTKMEKSYNLDRASGFAAKHHDDAADNCHTAITALRQMNTEPTSDELLWQEIFSLREKLKIAVEAIKSYDPEFDDRLFVHQLNSVDYDQLMEELSGEEIEPEPCEWCSGIYSRIEVKPCGNGSQGITVDMMNNGIVIFRHGFAMGYFDIKHCPNCGKPLRRLGVE